MFQRVAIVGVGLIGGSLGLALRGRGLADEVLGISRRRRTIDEAVGIGAIDSGSLSIDDALAADLIVLAAPVRGIVEAVRTLGPRLRPGCWMTDVGSTKAEVMAAAVESIAPGAGFVGGHPMAGSEQGGVGASRADLFEGAVYVLCRSGSGDAGPLPSLARAVGATPVEMDPVLHDEAVARISHLPHVVVAALAEAAVSGAVPAEVLRLLVAGGFKSTTRIAGSPPELWRDVCLTNRTALLAALDSFDGALARFRQALESGNASELEEAFARGGAARTVLVPPGGPTP